MNEKDELKTGQGETVVVKSDDNDPEFFAKITKLKISGVEVIIQNDGTEYRV